MGAAAVVVAKIAMSYIASQAAKKVVSKVADKWFGMDEEDANLWGNVAGMFAGAWTYGAAGKAAASGGGAASGAGSGAEATPLDASDVSGAPTAIPESQPVTPQATSYGSQINKPGLLTSAPEATVAPTTVAPVTTETATEPSFWEKMMESEKSGDIIASTVGGMAQGAMGAGVAEDAAAERKDKLEYERNKWNDVDVSK
ncbi:MAG: hypothetical protein IMF17_07675, partial [Proteobacteria bacterium]|nr:hypothetical protein [Pseudomonadota bacterium]